MRLLTLILPQKLATIVDGLKSLPDDKYRYKQLLFWADECPDMDISLKTESNKVPGCLSTVHVAATLEDGRVQYVGDSDAQLTKGLVALLVKGLSGSTPEEITAVDAAFIKEAGITASLTPGRNNGFINMLGVMKNKAAELGALGDGRGPVARAILAKLELLQPTSLDVRDDSHKHVRHAENKGGFIESHFRVDIVAECFADLSRVKRHKLIYTLLGPEIIDRLHAIQISAKTPAEAQQQG